MDNYRSMFESRVSVGAKEKLTSSERLDANISAWFHGMEDHSKKCAERFCELLLNNSANCTKSQRHAWMVIKSKEMDQLENYLLFAHKLF